MERPMECSECQRPAHIIYKEITGDCSTVTEMCEGCPNLEKKLSGRFACKDKKTEVDDSMICCANCLTTLEMVKAGNPMGCSNCYSVFGDLIIEDLLHEDKLPKRLEESKTLHLGKAPLKEWNSDLDKIQALQEALQEALKIENYEEAAFLRDKITELHEST
jgi:protein arginine kinase activator